MNSHCKLIYAATESCGIWQVVNCRNKVINKTIGVGPKAKMTARILAERLNYACHCIETNKRIRAAYSPLRQAQL